MARGTRPNIFEYQDFRKFLREVFAYMKSRRLGLSRKSVAAELGISLSNLSMILSGQRKLPHDLMISLGRTLALSGAEQRYFEALVTRDQAQSADVVVDSLRRMNGVKKFREKNPREADAIRYLTHWYYVAIREMSALPGFKLEAKWIKPRLSAPVPLGEIQRAIDFLLKRGYIVRKPDGTVVPPEKTLECMDGIYKVVLGQFHREVLDLAAKAVSDTPAAERNLMGFTFACSPKKFARANEIIERAYSELRDLADSHSGDRDSVYHAELCLFPLSRRERSGT